MKIRGWQTARLWMTPVLVVACACAGLAFAKEPVSPLPGVTVSGAEAANAPSNLPGADLAVAINRRYAQTPAKCFVANPAFDCSGVLLRPAPANAPGTEFWRIGTDETAAGYARLSYARQDLPAVSLSDSVGFVLADRPTAAGTGQPYNLICGRAPQGQSLPPCAGDPDAVGVSLWNVADPAALAVQAIYYDVAHGGQLSAALRYQKQYYDATGRWIPILQSTIGAGAATAFGFNERDQLDWGFKVAQRLEARYADPRMTCPPDGRAGYFCSGVLIRTSGHGAAFRSWNPSPTSVQRNGVSFSFARIDMRMNTTHSNQAGVIMAELQAPTGHPLTWRCSFPGNAHTTQRKDSCDTVNGDARLCDARGITTAAQWRAAYGTNSDAACGLSPTAAQFAVLQELRQSIGAHNEVILAAWPQDIPLLLPLEAFFYAISEARPGAQFIQQDYMGVTGHFMPVLWVDLAKPVGSIFVYRVEDQTGAMNPGALLAAPGNAEPDPDQ